MKKTAFLFLLSLFLSSSVFAADQDGRTERGVWGREGLVLGRGLVNVLTMPLELFYTPAREPKNHKWFWPITSIPRSVTHVFTRASSGLYDVVVLPWKVPFTDDVSPLTEPFDLPEYVWQKL